MKPEPIGSARLTKTIGIVLVSFCSSAATVTVWARITSGSNAMSSFARACAFRACGGVTIVNANIAIFRPPTLCQALTERNQTRHHVRVVLGQAHEHANAAHSIHLSRTRSEWPNNQARKQFDEFAPPHVPSKVNHNGALGQ
jgi:hypothetical protein